MSSRDRSNRTDRRVSKAFDRRRASRAGRGKQNKTRREAFAAPVVAKQKRRPLVFVPSHKQTPLSG
jgi:hypothetical protein